MNIMLRQKNSGEPNLKSATWFRRGLGRKAGRNDNNWVDFLYARFMAHVFAVSLNK